MADPLAPPEDIERLVKSLEAPGSDDLALIDAVLAKHPQDPRLHFMKGSILAGQSKHIEAHTSLSKAVEIAPEYSLARYQLGFFELTSGEADRALSTWGPLLREPKDNYLRVFVEGMTHVIRDEFTEAFAKFTRGLELNTENLPMNDDIRLLMREIKTKMDQNAGLTAGEDTGAEDTSAAALLLGQFGGNRTIN